MYSSVQPNFVDIQQTPTTKLCYQRNYLALEAEIYETPLVIN